MVQMFCVKDEGEKHQFASGMVRNVSEGKIDYDRIFDGPLMDRYAVHLTKGAAVYPDQENGDPNWMLANGPAELRRFRRSACRHFRQWLRGDTDEDHAAAVVFNLNGFAYVAEQLAQSAN